jgi:hypothetical protein
LAAEPEGEGGDEEEEGEGGGEGEQAPAHRGTSYRSGLEMEEACEACELGSSGSRTVPLLTFSRF